MSVRTLDGLRLDRAKRAFSTRRVAPEMMRTVISGDLRPTTGDLVLARVDAIGKQTKLELTDGRRAHLFPGDEIVVSYGNRYAPDQFEATVADDLASCDLVAAGGVAGVELSRHVRMPAPTRITPVGLIGDGAGQRLNLARFRVEAPEAMPDLPVVLSLGTSMNAGKTLTSTSLVRGFKRMGLKVAALKITGTGAGGDMWIVRDAGADVVLDFTDAGFASTYLTPLDEVVAGAYRLINHAAEQGCAVAVIEIADGLQQKETSQLIRSEALRGITLGCTFAAYDAMGAICGVRELVEAGHTVLGLSGRMGMSPLGVREAEAATGLRVYSPWDLQDGMLVPAIQRRAAQAFAASRFQRRSLLTLAQAVMPRDAAVAANGHDLPADGPEAAEQGRTVLVTAAEHVMEQEVAARCGTGPERTNRRNGVRRVLWSSGLGDVELKVPRLRQGSYAPSFLDAAVAPGEVEAVLRAVNASGREEAILGLLRSLGGPDLGRADALSVGARIVEVIGEPGLASGRREVGPAGQPVDRPPFSVWTEGSEIDALAVDEDEAPDFPNGIREVPMSGELSVADGVRALALPS